MRKPRSRRSPAASNARNRRSSSSTASRRCATSSATLRRSARSYDLAVHMSGWGSATLFVGEYTEEEMAHHSEFTIADGILRFSSRREDLTAGRMVEVFKLRGADCVPGRHFFEIGEGGLTFYARVRSPDEDIHASPSSFVERAST